MSAVVLLRHIRDFRDLVRIEQHAHLESFIAMLEALSRTALSRDHKDLRDAVRCTLRILCDYGFDIPEYQHLMNIRERADWICLEGAFALKGSVRNKRNLKLYREVFREDKHGTPEVWQLQQDFRYALENRAVSLQDYYEFRTQWKLNTGDVPRKRLSCLTDGLLQMEASLSTDKSEGWLTTSLKELCSSLRQRITSQTRFEFPSLTFETEIDEAIWKFERQLVYGAESGPRDAPKIEVMVYSNDCGVPVPDSVVSQMAEVCCERVIDRATPSPQLGFGRPILKEEIRTALAHPGTFLITLGINGKPSCFYLLHTDNETFPEYTKKVFQILGDRGELSIDRCGFLEYVVISEEASKLLHEHNLSGYGLISWIASHIVAEKQIDRLYCTCRSGAQANTATAIHCAHGWEQTGIEITPETLQGFSSDSAVVLGCYLYGFHRAVQYELGGDTGDRNVHFRTSRPALA